MVRICKQGLTLVFTDVVEIAFKSLAPYFPFLQRGKLLPLLQSY
jgi:hypothetical protein